MELCVIVLNKLRDTLGSGRMPTGRPLTPKGHSGYVLPPGFPEIHSHSPLPLVYAAVGPSLDDRPPSPASHPPSNAHLRKTSHAPGHTRQVPPFRSHQCRRPQTPVGQEDSEPSVQPGEYQGDDAYFQVQMFRAPKDLGRTTERHSSSTKF